ncbi:MAG: helix-hairpin-helix domain-containing protein [Clostridia bacterium]|nr:helix-hairpin-helix domain-containing protein [Clostridia bacterium]
MKSYDQKKVEIIKLILIVLLCVIISSGGINNYSNYKSSNEEILIEPQTQIFSEVDIEPTIVSNSNLIDTNPHEIIKEEETKKIDINSADSKTLQTLTGIGPTKAESIIQYRTDYGGFTQIEEITQVKGIGAATFLKIKDFITVN